jgi:hypothetical protein
MYHITRRHVPGHVVRVLQCSRGSTSRHMLLQSALASGNPLRCVSLSGRLSNHPCYRPDGQVAYLYRPHHCAACVAGTRAAPPDGPNETDIIFNLMMGTETASETSRLFKQEDDKSPTSQSRALGPNAHSCPSSVSAFWNGS